MERPSSVDRQSKDDDEEVTWADLPSVLLEDVYAMLTMRQRFNCSLVCRNWNDVLLAPRLWRTLDVRQETFRVRRVNRFHSGGFENRLSRYRVKMCLVRIGRHIHRLRVRPITDYFYLGQFLCVVSAFIEYFEEYPLPNLRAFEFTFACEVRDTDGLRVIGTGGKLLEELKCLLGNLRDLTEVTCNQLLLENDEAIGLLDMLINNSGHSLTRLEILNSTKIRYPLFYAGMLPRLRTLVITPLQLTPEVLMMVARHEDFRDLVIVQDPHAGPAEVISSRVWWDIKMTSPQLRVTLECRRLAESELPIQENAPVQRVIHRSAISRITLPSVLKLIDEYRLSLRVYAHLGLPRRHGRRAFRERGDSSLVLLVRECTNLQTLVVRERVSTATLLIIATEARALRTLHVRRNAVLLRCDWPMEDWDDEFRNLLKRTCKSYDLVEREISQLLGYMWTMMSDAAFKRLDI
ncbi:hypothetical protein NP493_34g05035 [Ridgeia piscesae]|uniref:F-box domain-containing protein n=1 Tax=Ridgeia piscesae TaxID=27915 RepID=A0AAD9PCN1_RIDPI|nr:hypothetical protein NP493_34g05035 [Ridgeia piscesae]